jgi:putative hemolysin
MDTTTAPSLVQEAIRAARPASRPAASLRARWARHEDEVQAAQRLRHAVFAGEMGATLRPPVGTPPGLDVDTFDRHCEHLIVLAQPADGQPEEVVGTYRVLTPAGARLAGGLYTETEFDLGPWLALRPRMAELGRSCIDPRWRTGGVILLLWTQLLQFMQRNGLDLMIGCASVPMHDGGHTAASLWEQLRSTHLAPERRLVQARLPLPLQQLRSDLAVEPPALIKGYLACGARVLGAPAWDPDFGCADLPMMLDLADLPASYRRRFGIASTSAS